MSQKGGLVAKFEDGVLKLEAGYGEEGKYELSLGGKLEILHLIELYVASTENKTDDAVAAVLVPLLKAALSQVKPVIVGQA